MFFIKLLDEEDVKYCREGIEGLHFQDGGATQPLNKSYNVKKNQQTTSVPEHIRKYLIDFFLDTIYMHLHLINKYKVDEQLLNPNLYVNDLKRHLQYDFQEFQLAKYHNSRLHDLFF